VAERLHMSDRTLKRQLAAEGTSFSTLVDEVRYRHATYCSPDCASLTQQVWALVFIMIVPSYHLIVASCLSLNMRYHFLVGFSVLLQQLVAILVLTQEMSTCISFYSAILN